MKIGESDMQGSVRALKAVLSVTVPILHEVKSKIYTLMHIKITRVKLNRHTPLN